jgi:hypothetical protein
MPEYQLFGIVVDFTPDPGLHVIGAIDSNYGIRHIGSAVIIVFVIGLDLVGLKSPGNFIVVFQATVVFKAAAKHGGCNQNAESSTNFQQTPVFKI